MKTVTTHNGGFHADDVFAVATLSLALKGEELQVLRTRDSELIEKSDIVVDVGRVYDPEKNRFDHHQEGGAGKRQSGIPYASFGLVWKTFAKNICSEEVTEIIDSGLVSFADGIDEGIDMVALKTDVPNFSLADVIGGFNRPGAKDEEIYPVFLRMVEMAKQIITNEVLRAEGIIEARRTVENVLESAEDKRLAVLDKQFGKVVLNEVLDSQKEVLFVVQPYDENGYSLRTVRKEKGSFENRKDLPATWAGKINDELEQITGVKGALFCHNKLFVANCATKEAAIALAKLALQN